MVTLFTWMPAPTQMVLTSGKMPDIGHSALAVTTDDGQAAYISFWPETDSLIGRITALWAPRPTRSPESYAQESDPDAPYLQRPADYVETLLGLAERRLIRGWDALKDGDYDAAQWNCSHVTRCLLTMAMGATDHACLVATGALTDDGAWEMAEDADLAARLSLIAASRVADCTPLAVRALALAYQSLAATEASDRNVSTR
jgi:hypothetical protein